MLIQLHVFIYMMELFTLVSRMFLSNGLEFGEFYNLHFTYKYCRTVVYQGDLFGLEGLNSEMADKCLRCLFDAESEIFVNA